MTTRILLDTDIGTYLDDALCLAYLLARDDCELLGITTTGGEANRRAMLASTLCWVAGRAVPVFPGAEVPLAAPQSLAHAPQAASLVRWPHQERLAQGRTSEFLSGVIRAYPAEVTLLAVGPLTNIARLAEHDPDCIGMLESLVIMGGVFTDERRSTEPWERNSSADPHACRIVYSAHAPIHRTVGLDVARRAVLPAAEVLRRLRGELLGPVREWAEAWLRDSDVVHFSDPLAATCVLDDVCRFERGTIEVQVLDGGAAPDAAPAPATGSEADAEEPRATGSAADSAARPYRARTTFEHDTAGPHELALDVNVERFFTLFWDEMQ